MPSTSDPTTVRPPVAPRGRLALLIAQGVSLGLITAVLVVAGNALFLTEYGSSGLPYTYIAMAVIGVPVSVVLARALRRWRLTVVSAATLLAFAAVLTGSWIGLRAGAVLLSGLLLVLFVLSLQVGFVIIGGQAGCLFDVREIKSSFPRVVSGFATGFMLGGFICPLVLRFTDATEDLLLFAVVVALVFTALVLETGRRFPAELQLVPQPAGVARPPLRTLFSKRFVLLIFVYQVLSAAGSQLLDFMIFDRAAARYTGSDELAGVISVYTATLNLLDIVVLALVAGWFMRRFGLRFGLSANPIAVGVILVALLGATAGTGTASLAVFLLAASARITDIITSDGTTRTSINAAYQVLPDADRLAVQATVEGVGVPVAIGLTGVVLIVADALGLGFVPVAVGTAALVVVWTISGVLVYRGYGQQLVGVLRRRQIDPVALTVDDTTLAALDRLLAGDDPRDVTMALDVLTSVAHPSAVTRLLGSANDSRPEVRAAALERLATVADAPRDPVLAAARTGLRDPDPGVRAAAAAVVGRHGSAVDAEDVLALADTDDRVVARAALAALRRRDDGPHRAAADRVRALATSPDPSDRALAAGVLADAPAAADVALVVELVHDPVTEVRSAALAAAAASPHHDLVAAVVEALGDVATASAAMAAANAMGDLMASSLDELLTAQSADTDASPALLRLVRSVGHVAAIDDVLVRHLGHDQRDVQLALLTAVGRRRAPGDDTLASTASSIVRDATIHGVRALAAAGTARAAGAAELARSLDDEVATCRRVVGAALGLRYDTHAVSRALRLIDDERGAQVALATEMLDVHLVGADHQLAMPLLTPHLEPTQRLEALSRVVDVPTAASADEMLADLIDDPDGVWRRPWLRTCARHTAERLGLAAERPPVQEPLPEGVSMPLSTVERVTALRRAPLFTGVPDHVLAGVARVADEVVVETDDPIIVTGDEDDSMLVVVSGALRVHTASGTVAELGPGDTVGELAVLSPEPRSASVTAASPGLLLRLSRPVFDELMVDHPELARSAIRMLVQLVRDRTPR